jgi:hypothetical protein
MTDPRRSAQRQAADREAGERRIFHDVLTAEVARVAAALHATMAAHREISPALLRAAQAGKLRRSNTRAGTPEREAVYRANYLARRAAAPERSAREALAHYQYEPGERRTPLFVYNDAGDAELITLDGLSLRDQKRASKYMKAVRALSRGRYRSVSGAYLYDKAAKRDFTRRFKAWAPIAGHRVVWRPDDALAIADEKRAAGVVIEFVSPPKRRSARSRR